MCSLSGSTKWNIRFELRMGQLQHSYPSPQMSHSQTWTGLFAVQRPRARELTSAAKRGQCAFTGVESIKHVLLSLIKVDQ